MSALDDLVGVTVLGLGAAVAFKVTDTAFKWASKGRKRTKKRSRRFHSYAGQGDFSNLPKGMGG